MKGLDYLRMSFGNVDAKLPPLKEVKPQHPLGKFSDYEDALDELCINALAKLTPEQREIIFRIEQLGKISLKHHKENVEMMKLVDKLIESIQSGKELSTELEGDMIELLKALKAERNDAGSKKNLYN